MKLRRNLLEIVSPNQSLNPNWLIQLNYHSLNATLLQDASEGVDDLRPSLRQRGRLFH